MRIYILASLIISATIMSIPSFGYNPTKVRFTHEKEDTTKITDILIKASELKESDKGLRIEYLAKCFLDTPYKEGTLEGEPELVTVNVEEFDCMTFVETVLAMEMTLDERRTSWMDFVYNLEKLRYRGGTADGYTSRLHYVSDWVVDNTHKGIMQDVTDRVANASSQIKTLDFMTSNRDKYPALKDDETFQKMKNAEVGYRSHKIPYIKTQGVHEANLRPGDIAAVTTSIKNLDATHIGFITMINGVPHLLHASSKAGKVIIDPLPLQTYLRRSKQNTGIRVIRMRD
ncbi:MAG: DUF1460 domain-containing protein [Muribaculaceae bacterium]|nr:DUF1460 domain-containing protein [Muribaculaceae bacterium]